MEKRYAKIISTGRYVPERVMTILDLHPTERWRLLMPSRH